MEPKKFESGLPALLEAFGKKTTVNPGNTAPLQAVFDRAMQPIGREEYDALIASIFTQAAQQVPTLTAALANASGGRTTGNSALALALNQQNNQAAQAAASAILQQQNTQQQIAANAAGNIASTTRGSQTTAPRVNPLTTMLGGAALNKAGRLFDRRGAAGGSPVGALPAADMAAFMPELYPTGMADFSATDLSGADLSNFDYSFGGATDVFDFADFGGAELLDFGSDALDFTDLGFGDFTFDPGFDPGQIFDDFWFADGGTVEPKKSARPYRTAMRPSFAPAINQTVLAYADGGVVGDTTPVNFKDLVNHRRTMLPPTELGTLNMMAPGYADGGIVRNRPNMGATRPLDRSRALNYSGYATAPAVQPTRPAPDVGENTDSADSAANSNPGLDLALEADAAKGYAGRNAAVNDFLGTLAMTVLGPSLGPAGQLAGQLAGRATGIATSPISLMTQLAKAAFADQSAQSYANSGFGMPGTMAVQGPQGGWSTQVSSPSILGTPGPEMSKSNMAFSLDLTGPAAEAGPSPGVFGGGIMGGDYGGAQYGGVQSSGSDAYGGPGMGDYGGSSGMDAMGGYGDNLADGGSVGARIKGPGTGTSDSIQASSGTPGMPAPRVSAGEVIVPTDTVNQFGELLFQNLIRASHRPVRR